MIQVSRSGARILTVAVLVSPLTASGGLAQGGYGAPACPFPNSPTYEGLPGVCHPYPQPRPENSFQRHFCGKNEVASCADCPRECLTTVDTGSGVLPAEMKLPPLEPGPPQYLRSPYSANLPPPFALPGNSQRPNNGLVPANPWNYLTYPGTNFLPNVYTNMFDSGGVEMANTLPSTPHIPYNLHPDPIVSEINPTSPEDDLYDIFNSVRDAVFEIGRLRAEARRAPDREEAERTLGSAAGEIDFYATDIEQLIGLGIAILEGNSLADTRLATRAYDGFPALHYKGPEKIKRVQPILDATGKVIGGNVEVHQIWFGQHVEADTAFLDPSEVLDVPWTVTYVIDTLNRGHDDFSPFADFVDTPWFHTEAGGSEGLTWNAGDYCTVGGSSEERRSGGCARLPWQFVEGTKNAHGFGTPCRKPANSGDLWIQAAGGSCAPGSASPHIGMDQTFFNMEEGTRTVFEIGMPPGDYLNLVYTWGWRMHPPRIQVMENALKRVPLQPLASSLEAPGAPRPDGICPSQYVGCALPQLEQAVFCNPATSTKLAKGAALPDGTLNQCSIPELPACTSVTATAEDKAYAIGQIGDLSPAKRMWRVLGSAGDRAAAFRSAWSAAFDAWKSCGRSGSDCDAILEALLEDEQPFEALSDVHRIIEDKAFPAYEAWTDRTELPCFDRDPNAKRNESCLDGLNPDPDSDLTLLYVNNTTYGQLTAGGWVRWPNWETRFASWETHGASEESKPVLDVTLLNADYFPHAYNIADFGGNRGWENQFKSSVKVAGSGCWFTFGRAHWWINTGKQNGFVCAPPGARPSADHLDGVPSTRRFEVTFNFEPSRRLRFYQFDPFHHDVAIYSVH